MIEGEIINRVANSGLITLNPEELRVKGLRIFFDMKECLFHGLILKENDFRQYVKDHDWTQYQDQHVAIGCTADAIVPAWAYMLVSLNLQPFAKTIFYGSLEELDKCLFREALNKIDFSVWEGKKIIVKGCGGVEVWEYVEMAARLRPYAHSVMYGEACSSVPLFKKPSAVVARQE